LIPRHIRASYLETLDQGAFLNRTGAELDRGHRNGSSIDKLNKIRRTSLACSDQFQEKSVMRVQAYRRS
jgi:hypothetical protein